MLESELTSVCQLAIASATDAARLDSTAASIPRTGLLFPCASPAAAFFASATSAHGLESLGWKRVEN